MNEPLVILHIKDHGDIQIQLDPTHAPLTCANFISLVRSGFYDGLTFHRIIPHFMIQGGDPLGNGTGGPGYTIHGEFRSNGFDNPIQHKRGVISMARAMDPDSAGSQFFIMHEDAAHLDGQYAAFGHVIDGMDVVDTIAMVKTNAMDRPIQPVVIEKAEVDTFGVDDPFEGGKQ